MGEVRIARIARLLLVLFPPLASEVELKYTGRGPAGGAGGDRSVWQVLDEVYERRVARFILAIGSVLSSDPQNAALVGSPDYQQHITPQPHDCMYCHFS